jgi:hypothetical protein
LISENFHNKKFFEAIRRRRNIKKAYYLLFFDRGAIVIILALHPSVAAVEADKFEKNQAQKNTLKLKIFHRTPQFVSNLSAVCQGFYSKSFWGSSASPCNFLGRQIHFPSNLV